MNSRGPPGATTNTFGIMAIQKTPGWIKVTGFQSV